MTKKTVNHGRATHIDIKYHHIHDEVKRGEVKLDITMHRRLEGQVIVPVFSSKILF
ncbi:hypothetical protein F441_18374 [Phytophthora nicotianae CJ01A1]|uniref:Copia protein n=1 Tax=Phytophthora nicotianae CJ01A1 TaxID=1317063 RepID=W2W3E6_PHYNI|nr:hypothetical protein F441_18374 [Phytophthora nicotianae CJ01A1]